MKCLILAAGRGRRLSCRAEAKPLCPLLGLPLIHRAILTAQRAGATEFYVVLGHRAQEVRDYLQGLDLPLKVIINQDWHKGENGLSVLRAREYLRGQTFLLLMADHVLEPALPQRLLAEGLKGADVALAVDTALENPLVDVPDATKVRLRDSWVADIGKGLGAYDGYDTGVFLCSEALFDALGQCVKEGRTALTDAVRLLAQKGRVRAVKTAGLLWVDVDSPQALKKAEGALLRALREKPTDGPVARHFNRPLSVRLSRVLVRTPITPNQLSLLCFLLSGLAALLMAMPGHLALALGGLLAQAASVLDGSDGEVARLKLLESEYGAWFDAVLDRYSDGLLLLGLTWHAWGQAQQGTALLWGFGAVMGSFALSYTADKYDQFIRRRLSERGRPPLRLGRDLRVFLIALGAVANQALAALVLLAVLMNGEVLRRLLLLRAR